MSDLIHQSDGMRYELLLDGVRDATRNFASAITELDPDVLTRREGPTQEETKFLRAENPDIIIADALDLVEDLDEIFSSEAYKKASAKGFVERQYAVDVAVGDAVAQNLWAVTNSAEMRALLPFRTAALFEVNANRGFDRGWEDSAGCYGPPLSWLGHVVIDSLFVGEATSNTRRMQEASLDYSGEPGSWTTDGSGLERNAARIRIRPTYPLLEHSRMGGPGPRETYEARVAGKSKIGEHGYVPREWMTLRGEYRICRAVSVLHNLTDWQPSDFESSRDIIARQMDVQRAHRRAVLDNTQD